MAWPWKDGEKPPNPETPLVTDPPKAAPVSSPPPEKPISEVIAESIRAELKPLSDRMSAIEGRIPAPRTEHPPDAPKPPASVWDNEDAAFNERLTPILATALQTRADLILDRVSREYSTSLGDLWTLCEKEVVETVKKSPPMSQVDEVYIRNVTDMVVGRMARANGFRANAGEKKFFLEDTSAAASRNGPPSPESGFTKDQLRMLQKQGIPLDKAKETLSRLEIV